LPALIYVYESNYVKDYIRKFLFRAGNIRKGGNMLNAFDYKNMWEEFRKKYGEEYLGYEGGQDVGEVMDEFKKDYIKKNKNKLGYHDVEEFYKD